MSAPLPSSTEGQVRAIGTADLVDYRFALAHRQCEVNREHLFASLIPLYLGRTASFVVEMQSAGPAEVEARVERLALVFEALKPLLVADWPASDKEVSS